MIEYPKIETLYDRDPENMKRVIVGQLRDPAFGLVDRWLVTEKVDGTNIRVHLSQTADGPVVRFGGRTADAQMPTFLLDHLTETFPVEKVAAAFDEGTEVVLFGEGYGPKIQKGGGDYAQKPMFILFDVAVISAERIWWLNWDTGVEDVADKLDIPSVPVLAPAATTEEAISLVERHSHVAALGTGTERKQEGIVCRTDPLLFTRRGDRLIWKLKGRDLA